MTEGLSTKDRSLVQISDKYRDLRFAVRRVTELPLHGDGHERESAIYNMAHALANVSNRFLNTAESGLITILGVDLGSHKGHAPAYGFDRYFELGASDPARGEGGASGRRGGASDADDDIRMRFVRDQYFAAKRVLLTAGVGNALLHQERFVEVWSRCQGSVRALAGRERFGQEALCRLCAAFTLATVAAEPVRSPRRLAHAHLDAPLDINVFLAAALATVAGVTVENEDDADSDVIYESGIAAAMVRGPAIGSVLRRADSRRASHSAARALDELAEIFAATLPHLP